MRLGKYSFGTGDRFGHQGEAQLRAIMKANEMGIHLIPVWNKSFREHTIVHSQPSDVRKEADEAVKNAGWKDEYYVDADHINIKNVDLFLDCSNFFTIDVADYIGRPAGKEETAAFIKRNSKYLGKLQIPGIDEAIELTGDQLAAIASRYLYAVTEASRIYHHIAAKKGRDNFVAEISMDEVSEPQTPLDLFFILGALAALQVEAQTIAPRFTGRFNKGVDYEGDVQRFAKEFEDDLLVIDHAIREFGLPANLKLSIHSGSDKFAIYPAIGRLIRKYDKGIHVKTAGTTWLEEIIGLALSGKEGLHLACDIYEKALGRYDEMTGPYVNVLNIDRLQLPDPREIRAWNSEKFASALRHEATSSEYNPHFRQFMHVSYKIAAEAGSYFTGMLKKHAAVIAEQVTLNLFDRHIKRIFNC